MQDPAAETLDKESLPVLEHKLEKLADTVKSGLKKQVGFGKIPEHQSKCQRCECICLICSQKPLQ